jgi:hypothetical protein
MVRDKDILHQVKEGREEGLHEGRKDFMKERRRDGP